MPTEYTGSVGVNFFRSEEIYETNKDSLVDTDIAFVPFNGMELSGDTEGYVRDESTGLTIQWSYGTAGRTWTFPVPFTAVYYAASSSNSTSKSSSGLDYVNNVTNTSMKSLGHGDGSYLIAIGIS